MATVLVVDDSTFMRQRCVALVHELGHSTMEAADGRQAVQRYKQIRPQVVLMDITMPHTDGLAALREIMAFDPNAKVAMVTAIREALDYTSTWRAVGVALVGFIPYIVVVSIVYALV